jgi:sugar lactone lactonase YvrE
MAAGDKAPAVRVPPSKDRMKNQFKLDLAQVGWVGHGLSRPECVLATRAGTLYCSDWRGGVVRIDASERQQSIGCVARKEDTNFMPNGIALLRDQSVLVANLGEEGGVWRLFPDGHREPWVMEIDGERLPAVNFVWLDDLGRVWITVMFRTHPGAGRNHFRADIGDGFIAVVDSVDATKSARIAAENIFTPNECRISLDGRWMNINETFSNRLVRYPLRADGSLGARDVFVQFDDDTLPDGLTLDAEGGLWITGIAANRIIRVLPDGSWHTVAEDTEAKHMAAVRKAIDDGTLDRKLLYTNAGKVLPNVTSLAFGGPDLKTAYIGSVSGEGIAVFRTPVAGVAPPHWNW